MILSPVPTASRHALTFVLLTVLIDTIGFGIVLPVLPELIRELRHGGLDDAARWGGWLAFAYAAMQFICAPIIGNLSDRFGRRPVLLASLAAFGIDYLVMAFAPTLLWLFVGRLIAGMTGAAYATANAYIADITPPEKRSENFGLVGAAFGVGFILGPAIGGFLGDLGPRAPFFVASGLALVNVAYGWLVLPESLAPEKRRPFSFAIANPFGTFGLLAKHRGVLALAMALMLWMLGHQVLPSVWTYYTMLRFQWDERLVGLSLAAAGVSMIVVQGTLTRVAIPRLGERRAAMIGLTFGAAGYLVYAAAPAGWVMFLGLAVSALAGLVYPSVNGLMSRHAGADEQGALQGAIGSLYGLTEIVGPIVMTQLFAIFSSPTAPFHFPGAPFALAGVLAMAALWLVVRRET
jgi:DHA1 family tetracycline resistance protein-like MFS transporter